jgi:hypothetical protein
VGAGCFGVAGVSNIVRERAADPAEAAA